MSLIAKGIEINSDVCGGKPVVAGTRITVETVLNFLASGDSVEDILEGYSQLKEGDIQACLAFAAKLVGGAEIHVATAA